MCIRDSIIAMTAHAFAGEREKCLSYGMNEYISKPIREEQLYELISRFTSMNTTAKREKKTGLNTSDNVYQFINLAYMKEVSAGNTDYEKTITKQFIEAIPGDLAEMEKAFQQNDITSLRQLAHNMKTTVSVMGLNEMLQPYLDAIEYQSLAHYSFLQQLENIKSILNGAMDEAKTFYASL